MKLYKFEHFKYFSDKGYYTLFRLSKNWDEASANWEKNTSTTAWTTTGGDYLPAPIDSFYYDGQLNNAWFTYDVTNAVSKMVKNPESNFGFIIKITGFTDSTKPFYHESHFHSSEATDASRTPRLIVIGSPGTGVAARPAMPRHFSLRSSRNAISVYFPKRTPYSVAVTDYRGRTLFKKLFAGKADWVRIPCRLVPGVYCVTVQSGSTVRAQKAMVF